MEIFFPGTKCNYEWVYPEAHGHDKCKKNFMALFMDGVRLSQGYRAATRRQFTFYHSNGNGLLNIYRKIPLIRPSYISLPQLIDQSQQ